MLSKNLGSFWKAKLLHKNFNFSAKPWPNFCSKTVQNQQKWHIYDQNSAKNGHFWGLKVGKKWSFWGQKSAADFTKILIGYQTSKIGSLPIYRLSWQHWPKKSQFGGCFRGCLSISQYLQPSFNLSNNNNN